MQTTEAIDILLMDMIHQIDSILTMVMIKVMMVGLHWM